MATYLNQDVLPQIKDFTPNYEFIMRALQMKQTQYDQGFAKIKSVYNSILNADILGEDHKQRRNDIIANAEKALKDLPAMDLSLPQNVTTAKQAFQPFYEDQGILHDIYYTKQSKANLQGGMALQNAEDEEDRNRYWSTGVQYIYDGMEEYKNATDEQRKNMSARRYVAKPNVDDEILSLFKDGKLKISRDGVSGQVKYTDENGAALREPLMNLYLAKAENDPEVMEAFKIMGSVSRTGYIRENAERFGGKQQAAEAFDNNMIRKYKENKQYQIDKINESLANISSVADNWEKQAKNGELKQKDVAQAARDIADRDRLKESLKSAQTAYNEADERIKGNPTAYLGNIYLNKNAADLATALSQFGSRKIESNPIYKDFVFPKELEVFKHELAKEMEKIKADERIRIKEAEADIKDESGEGGGGSTSSTSSGGGGSASRKTLDVPFVEENIAGAKTPLLDELDQPDAYTMQANKTKAIISDLDNTKLRFIETVLNNSEIVDSKGKYIGADKRSDLLNNGAELDRLYNLAIKKHDGLVTTNDPKMYSSLDLRERVNTLNDVWSASIAFRKDKLGQITNELAGLNKDKDGYAYKSFLKDGLIPANNYTELQGFLDRTSKTKEFEEKAKERYKKNLDWYNENHYIKSALIPGYGLYEKGKKLIGGKPTLEQAKTELLSEMKEKFASGELAKNVTQMWNKYGFAYYGQEFGKGGGIYSRTITYQGANNVKGEKADVYAQDLFEKVLSPNAGDDNAVKVTVHSDKPTTDDIENNEDVKNILMGRIKNDIFAAIKVGKGSDLGSYSIGFSGTAGDKGQYHKYTLKFDQDYVNKLIETKTKSGGSTITGNIDKEIGKSLLTGIDIYVAKDKGAQSAMARASTIGEIDILLNDPRNQNTIKREITPGYGVQIEKLHTGGYRMMFNYKQYSKDNLNGSDKVEEMILPEGTDITNAYYESLKKARMTYDANQKAITAMEERIKNDPNMQPVTYQQLLELSRSMRSGY